ncbi:GNAT family N-acetyltransferase [Hymenobacter busanensis]|uniref:GNAT family N-acetyltransferase n=1 Tax=Hymenobacter busanensis TaxID=2607656 RepID=A0A7L4ZXH7_9BACT|nr:GNAT family protein [Hymenobacter busanensis]KAA9332136.1 GNAT family N-acetyltransferase [Hymenobacter busanensis]QHJ07525.1 GNAT family N-acetyltransferase [Hymenobacter busanensis]
MSFPPTPLPNARVYLRRLQPHDAPTFAAYRADPAVARYQSWDTYTLAQATEFVATYGPADIPGPPGTWRQLAIALCVTDGLIGDCALHLIADEPRIAEIGITLSPAYQGQGYAREALRSLLGYCFTELQLHRVYAITDALNLPAARLLESAGMRREGHFRQHVWFKGGWGDEFLYAVLREEWQQVQGSGKLV